MPNKKSPKKYREPENEEVIQKTLTVKQIVPTKEIVKPILFFGNLEDDIDSWLKNFDRIAIANEWDLEKKTTILPAFLRDRAAEFFESLDDDIKENYHDLCRSLRDRFIPKELQSLYYSNLFQARQKDNQTVEDYASEINKLAIRAYSDMKRSQKDVLIKEHFIQGLKPEIKRFVMLSNPSTFEEAFRAAQREECNNNLMKKKSETACAVNENSLEYSVKELSDQVKVLAVKFDSMSQRRNFRNRGTSRGRNQGRFGRGRFGGSTRNLRTTDGRPICNFCMKVGHIERSCEEKRKSSGN